MTHIRNRLALLLLMAALPLGAQDTNWPQFRGPRGDGTSLSTNLPLHFGEQQNIKWKTPIHGKAWSSPVIWGQQIWITTATEDGHELFVVCVERDSGKIIQDVKLFDVTKPQYCIPFNSYASPTPAIEEKRLYVSFGAPGLACVDTENGSVLWTRRDLVCNHYRGAGSSPILYGNLFILNFDGSDHQFVVALDKETGRTVWQQNRSLDYKDLGADGKPESEGDYRKAFATCQVATLDGRPTLLSQGSKAFYAYEPLTGAEFWRVEERSGHSAGTRPLTGHGLVFVPSGFSAGQILAIRPGKTGEVLDAKTNGTPTMQLQVVWKVKNRVPKKPSLLLQGDLLYAIDDNGNASCWEALTGKTVWSESISGHYSASPLLSGNRIYLFSEGGKVTVLATGREFKPLAETQLGDGFMASPAVSGQALFLRSRTSLYRVVGERPET
jgi:outer membrane protein assembly factor BamB